MTTQLQAPVADMPVAETPVTETPVAPLEVPAPKRAGLLARIGASLLRANKVYADLATNHSLK